jgi:hypothetical protein
MANEEMEHPCSFSIHNSKGQELVKYNEHGVFFAAPPHPDVVKLREALGRTIKALRLDYHDGSEEGCPSCDSYTNAMQVLAETAPKEPQE